MYSTVGLWWERRSEMLGHGGPSGLPGVVADLGAVLWGAGTHPVRPGELASKGGKDSQPWTDDEEESVQDMAIGDGPAQSLGRAKIERSVTGRSVEENSRHLVGPRARGGVVRPMDRDRASS